jgi:hypothetical protein
MRTILAASLRDHKMSWPCRVEQFRTARKLLLLAMCGHFMALVCFAEFDA